MPTFDAVVQGMLTMAHVTPQDLVIDLGAGDGRIAIAAAKAPFGARSVGIEYDPDLARLSTGTTGGTVEGVGRLRGALRNAPWAEMPEGCRRYYGQ